MSVRNHNNQNNQNNNKSNTSFQQPLVPPNSATPSKPPSHHHHHPNHHYNIMINNSFNAGSNIPLQNNGTSTTNTNKSPPPPLVPGSSSLMNNPLFFPQTATSNNLLPSPTTFNNNIIQPPQPPTSTIAGQGSSSGANPLVGNINNNNSLYEQLLLQEQLFSAFLHNYYQYQRMMMEQQNQFHSLYSQQQHQATTLNQATTNSNNHSPLPNTSSTSIGDVQHHAQPPLLINPTSSSSAATSSSNFQLLNQNVQPTGMTSVAIPEPLYELYIRPILQNLQQSLYKIPSNDGGCGSSGGDQMGVLEQQQQQQQFDNSAIFLSPSDVTNHHRHQQQPSSNISTTSGNDDNNQQSFLESLLTSVDEHHLPPVDTMLLYSNHQLDADKEEEKNSPQPHKAYDPKKNKKGLKKKRKYIKSGLFKKDRDGNFLISSNDRARLAQFGLSMPKQEGEEGEVLLMMNGEDEQQFYEEEEEEEDNNQLTQMNDSINNNSIVQDHHLINDLLLAHNNGLDHPQIEPHSITTRFTEEQSQMGFEWYFAEQFQNFPSANDFFQQEEEKSQMRIFVWAQWQLLHDSEKQHYIEMALASQREMLQQVNQIVASSSLAGSSSSVTCCEPSTSSSSSSGGGRHLLINDNEPLIESDELPNPRVDQNLLKEEDDEDQDPHTNEESKELDKNVTANRVKKPLSGYNSFVKSVFPSFQEMYPNIDKKQITKLIGQKWKAMTGDEKQPYIEMARQAQPIIKKPLNAYNIYCKEKYSIFKEENPDLAPNEVSRMVASSWKKAKKEEKQKYYDLAEKWKLESDEMISSAVEKQTKQKSKKRKI